MKEGLSLNFLKKIFRTKSIKERTLEERTIEEDLREKLYNLKDLKIKDFLIPRNQIKAIDLSSSWEEIKIFIMENPHLLYPVYKGSLDHYLGYVRLKDLIRKFKETFFEWEAYLKPALTLPESLNIFTAIKKMQEKEITLSFIVDDLSEFVGIFCIKDVMEEIFSISPKYLKVDPEGWITLSATTKLHKLEKYLNLKIEEGDFETLAGFILHHLQRIPKEGEKFSLPPFEIEVLKADAKKIDKVRLRKLS
ncbi:MAG: transporter associated domain-containing protein [Caldimicrobium sp.]